MSVSRFLDDTVQLVSVSLPSQEVTKLAAFYEKTLGVKFAFSLTESRESLHTVISAGVQLVIDKIRRPEEKSVMLHFAVGNLEKFKKNVVSSGGKVVSDDIPLPISDKVFNLLAEEHKGLRSTHKMGTFAVIRDPEGNAFGAIQLEDWAHYLFSPGNITMVESENHKSGIRIGQQLKELLK